MSTACGLKITLPRPPSTFFLQFDEGFVELCISNMSGVSFVSEEELVDIREKRQKEWEKVRKEDDPLGKLTFLACLLI